MGGSHVMCETESHVKGGKGCTEWRIWGLGAVQTEGGQILENRSICAYGRKCIYNHFSKALLCSFGTYSSDITALDFREGNLAW